MLLRTAVAISSPESCSPTNNAAGYSQDLPSQLGGHVPLVISTEAATHPPSVLRTAPTRSQTTRSAAMWTKAVSRSVDSTVGAVTVPPLSKTTPATQVTTLWFKSALGFPFSPKYLSFVRRRPGRVQIKHPPGYADHEDVGRKAPRNNAGGCLLSAPAEHPPTPA